MVDGKWLDGYSGQSVDELLKLEGEFRTDSIVAAFEQAIDQKALGGSENLSNEERAVLAVEALEREVNNGGFDQFFINAPEHAAIIKESLQQMNCPQTSEVAQRALTALNIPDLSAEKIQAAMAIEDEARDDALNECDELYYSTGEDIAGHLLAFIKLHKSSFKL
jgi:hypothetical protein